MQTDYRSLLLSPRGRLSRRDFWIAAAGMFAVEIVAGLLPYVGPVASALLLWPWSRLSAKRLHDMNRPAAWLAVPLVPTAAMAVLGIASSFAPAAGGALFVALAAGATLGGITIILSLGFLVWIGITPGSGSTNQFGPAPASIIAF